MRIPDTGSAGASFAGAASDASDESGAAAESSSDLTAVGGGDGALEAVLAPLFLADSDGLNGGGATGSLDEERRVPDMTCALIDCGGGRYPALCPKPAQSHKAESRHATRHEHALKCFPGNGDTQCALFPGAMMGSRDASFPAEAGPANDI